MERHVGIVDAPYPGDAVSPLSSSSLWLELPVTARGGGGQQLPIIRTPLGTPELPGGAHPTWGEQVAVWYETALSLHLLKEKH